MVNYVKEEHKYKVINQIKFLEIGIVQDMNQGEYNIFKNRIGNKV